MFFCRIIFTYNTNTNNKKEIHFIYIFVLGGIYMKLTVIGNNGPYPKAGGACSGYLLEDGSTKILIDCGNGVLSALLKVCDAENLDAILLSHLHSDHMSDVLILKYAIGLKKLRGKFEGSIPLYLPMEDQDLVSRLNYNDAFNIIPIIEEESLTVNELEIKFKEMVHPVKTYGIKVKKEDKVFVYSGDTSYNDGLVELADEADFFLCESGILEKDKDENSNHLTPKEAGDIATKAKVKRLVLTHFSPEYRLDKIMHEDRKSVV